MPRSFLSLGAAAIITLSVIVTLDSGARSAAAAQSRNPLTGGRPGIRPAPAWRNVSWLNTTDGRPVTLASLRGQVVLLNFWTFTCWNCAGALPSLVEFDNRYRPQGLTVIGIHSPEFPPYGGEHDRDNVARALQQHHIEYPNAQDNDHATWDLYQIRFWPSFVLIDRRGNIRYEGVGEFHRGDPTHLEWETRIRTLLADE